MRTIAPTIENTTSSFSPDGSLFAVGQSAGTAKVLQVSASPNWNLVSQFQSGSLFAHIAFLSNSNLAIGNSNVNVWDANTGTLIRNVGDIRNKITALAFSADGQTLVTAHLAREAADESIQLRNVIDGTLRNISFPQSVGLNITQMGITGDGQRIVTLDGSNPSFFIKVWNALNGSLIRNTQMPNSAGLTLVVSPDNQSYIVSGDNFPATQYSISDGTVIRVIGTGCIEKALAISPDGTTLATTKAQCAQQGENGLILYRISDGAVLQHIFDTIGQDGNASIKNGVFSPDSQTLAVSMQYNGIINPKPFYIFRISDGARIRQFAGHQSTSDGIAFSPDGQTIASTSWDNTARLWRVSDATLLRTYDEETIFGNSDLSGISFLILNSRQMVTALLTDAQMRRSLWLLILMGANILFPEKSLEHPLL